MIRLEIKLFSAASSDVVVRHFATRESARFMVRSPHSSLSAVANDANRLATCSGNVVKIETEELAFTRVHLHVRIAYGKELIRLCVTYFDHRMIRFTTHVVRRRTNDAKRPRHQRPPRRHPTRRAQLRGPCTRTILPLTRSRAPVARPMSAPPRRPAAGVKLVSISGRLAGSHIPEPRS